MLKAIAPFVKFFVVVEKLENGFYFFEKAFYMLKSFYFEVHVFLTILE